MINEFKQAVYCLTSKDEGKSFYSFISEDKGFRALQTYFIKIALFMETDLEEQEVIASSQPHRGEMAGCAELDEQRFIDIAAQTFGIDEFQAIQIFESLTMCQREQTQDVFSNRGIGFKDFYLLTLLFSAQEEKQLLHFLYKFGPFAYDHLCLE